jgi:protein phosphatase
MGTTVVASAIVGGNLYVAHVGDSRAYFLRDEVLHPLTRDHTLVNEQVERNLLTEEEALRSSQRHVLSRAVGKQREVKVDLAPALPLRKGDMILLCSDGLCGYVTDGDIEYNLRLYLRDPEQAARSLLMVADQGGSDDNITIVVILVESVGSATGPQLAVPAITVARPERSADKTQPVTVRRTVPTAELPAPEHSAPAAGPRPRRNAFWPVIAVVGSLLGLALGVVLAGAVLMPTMLQFRASLYDDEGVQGALWQASDVIQGTPVAATATPEVRTVVLTSIATPTPAPTGIPPSPVVYTVLAPVTIEVTREVTVVVTTTPAPTATPTTTPTATPNASPTAVRWLPPSRRN